MNSEAKPEFDEFAENYDQLLHDTLGSFGGDAAYYAENKASIVRRHILRAPRAILEFGCGTGRNMPFLQRAFPDASVSGSDISRNSLRVAQQANPACRFFHPDDPAAAEHAERQDLVFVACVFHHIPVPLRQDVMQKAVRLLAPRGELFVFEVNPWNPATRWIMKRSPFDRHAVMLRRLELTRLAQRAGLAVVRTRYCTFFPAALRCLSPLEDALGWLPLGAQYYLHAQKSERSSIHESSTV